jgi:hypothetical protein
MGVKMHCDKKEIQLCPAFVILVTWRRWDNSAPMIKYENSVRSVGGSIGSAVEYSTVTLQMTCPIT